MSNVRLPLQRAFSVVQGDGLQVGIMNQFCRQCGVPTLGEMNPDGLCVDCADLQKTPDGLSKRKTLMSIPLEDLKQVDEDERIKRISDALKSNPGKIMSLLVDAGPAYHGKGDRYISKIQLICPQVKLVSRFRGPVKNCETLNLRHG